MYDIVILSKYCLAVCKMCIFIAIIWFHVIIIQNMLLINDKKLERELNEKIFAVVICTVMIVSATACTGSILEETTSYVNSSDEKSV